jgi:hypothetical protein
MTQQSGGGHARGRRRGRCAHGGADAADLADLDALVDALIEAELAAGGRAAAPDPAAAPNVIVPRHWRAAPRTEGRADAHDGCCGGDDGPFEAAEMLRPEAAGELDLDLDSDPDLEADAPLDFAAADAPAGDEDDCFRLEERVFIDRAVRWLAPRGNKDLILGRIWARVMDADPAAFFEPEPGPRADGASATASVAPEQDPGRAADPAADDGDARA